MLQMAGMSDRDWQEWGRKSEVVLNIENPVAYTAGQ